MAKVRIADWVDAKDIAFVKVMFEGSGDLREEHEIVGVAFCDSVGNHVYNIGVTRGEDRSEGQKPTLWRTSMLS